MKINTNYNAKITPTQEYLKECFDYDPEVGVLIRKERPRHHFKTERAMNIVNNRSIGKRVGFKSSKGYLCVILEYETYTTHRIIWKLFYGIDPVNLIDHINGIKDDNRICNLREATYSENARSKNKIPSVNKSGCVGVYYSKKDKMWIATITFNKKRIHLGSFKNVEDAIISRKEADLEYYGEFRPKCNSS